MPFFPSANLQARLGIDPVYPLVIILPSVTLKKIMKTPVSPPRKLVGFLLDRCLQGSFRLPFGLIVVTAESATHQPTCPTDTDRIAFLRIAHSGTLRRGLYQFFEFTSFRIWMSNAWSATIRFNRRFSSSSALSRLASFTSNPPYRLFHRYNVASHIQCRRTSSFAGTPHSNSFNIPMICSSLNRFVFISCPPGLAYPTGEN